MSASVQVPRRRRPGPPVRTPVPAAAHGHGTRPRVPRALVLAPTRELAQQVSDTLAPLRQALGLHVTTVYGGAPMYRQVQQLRRGVDVVIATPGRLLDLMRQGEATLDAVVVTV